MDYRPSIIPMSDLESAARNGAELAEQERTPVVTTSESISGWWPIFIGLILD